MRSASRSLKFRDCDDGSHGHGKWIKDQETLMSHNTEESENSLESPYFEEIKNMCEHEPGAPLFFFCMPGTRLLQYFSENSAENEVVQKRNYISEKKTCLSVSIVSSTDSRLCVKALWAKSGCPQAL